MLWAENIYPWAPGQGNINLGYTITRANIFGIMVTRVTEHRQTL